MVSEVLLGLDLLIRGTSAGAETWVLEVLSVLVLLSGGVGGALGAGPADPGTGVGTETLVSEELLVLGLLIRVRCWDGGLGVGGARGAGPVVPGESVLFVRDLLVRARVLVSETLGLEELLVLVRWPWWWRCSWCWTWCWCGGPGVGGALGAGAVTLVSEDPLVLDLLIRGGAGAEAVVSEVLLARGLLFRARCWDRPAAVAVPAWKRWTLCAGPVRVSTLCDAHGAGPVGCCGAGRGRGAGPDARGAGPRGTWAARTGLAVWPCWPDAASDTELMGPDVGSWRWRSLWWARCGPGRAVRGV